MTPLLAATRAGMGIRGGPVYVGGLDRSGKTTMAGFLSSHPGICIPAVGSNMWTYFYGQYGDLSRPENAERCLAALLRYKHVRFLEPDPERIRREFAEGPRTYARLFSLFLIHYAERQGKPRWGAQTGLIERYADRLFAAYPGLRVIHMVRDPRDRYEASLARWPDGRGRAGGATARWQYSTALAHRHAARYPGAYRIVRFEDLITETEATLRRVCAFLDEPYYPDMMRLAGAPTLREKLTGGDNGAPGAAVPHGERTEHALVAPLSTGYIGRFRQGVPPQEIAFIQLHARRGMRAHGYAPQEGLLPGMSRVRFFGVDWPNQAARMLAWRGVETLQQRFPAWAGRKPGARMIVGTSTVVTT